MSILLTMLFGNQIDQIMPHIALCRIDSFKEYPYLYQGTIEGELEYLTLYKKSKHSLVIQESQSPKTPLVIGAPLLEIFPQAKTVVESCHYNAEEWYYIEEITLPLENISLVFEIFKALEAQASKWHYKNMCLMTIKKEEDHPLKPAMYKSIEPLFEELGYSITNLSMPISYSTFCADGSVQKCNHEFIFWIKKLN